MNQLLSEGLYEQARKDTRFFHTKKLLTEDSFSDLKKYINAVEAELSLRPL